MKDAKCVFYVDKVLFRYRLFVLYNKQVYLTISLTNRFKIEPYRCITCNEKIERRLWKMRTFVVCVCNV